MEALLAPVKHYNARKGARPEQSVPGMIDASELNGANEELHALKRSKQVFPREPPAMMTSTSRNSNAQPLPAPTLPTEAKGDSRAYTHNKA